MPHHIDSGNLDWDRRVGVAWVGLFPGPVDRKSKEGSGGCCEAVSCTWPYLLSVVFVRDRVGGWIARSLRQLAKSISLSKVEVSRTDRGSAVYRSIFVNTLVIKPPTLLFKSTHRAMTHAAIERSSAGLARIAPAGRGPATSTVM